MKIRKRSDEPRDTVLTIRLSRSEKEFLQRLASKAGMSVSAYILSKFIYSPGYAPVENK